MPVPQFMKQISAERNITTPGTLLRLDPEATSAGATHLMVLGNDEFGNVILLPGESRSELLGAAGDVHCWVLPSAELESLNPTYDGKIPDHLRLVSIEAQIDIEIGDTVYLVRREYDTEFAGTHFVAGLPLSVNNIMVNPNTTNNGALVVDQEGRQGIFDLGLFTKQPPKFESFSDEGTSAKIVYVNGKAGVVGERWFDREKQEWFYRVLNVSRDRAGDGSDLFLRTPDDTSTYIPESMISDVPLAQQSPELTGEDDIIIARLMMEKAAQLAPKFAPGDVVNYSEDLSTDTILDISLTEKGYQYYLGDERKWWSQQMLEYLDITKISPRIPAPKFLPNQAVYAGIDGEWLPTIIWRPMWIAEFNQWQYKVQKSNQQVEVVSEDRIKMREYVAPELTGEEDLVIGQSQPKKLTYDPENPGQYFYLERPAEEAPPATPVDEEKIPDYLYEKQKPVQKNIKPSTPVMQDLRQDLKDPDRMLKALAIHIHELEVLRSNITKFSENVNAALDYARRGLEQVQVSGEDDPMLLREVAPFKHRDPMGNLLATPEKRQEWVKARQAVTILDKIRSGLETTGLMVVNFRGIVYELRHETELIVRASQHATDPKVAGFRDWAMTFNEFSVWWDAKRIEQNRQIKNVQGALKSAWKRYRTKHAFFYRRILKRYGSLMKEVVRVFDQIKRIGQINKWDPKAPYPSGINVKQKGNPSDVRFVKYLHTNDRGQWVFEDNQRDWEERLASLYEPVDEEVEPPPPTKFNAGDMVEFDHYEIGRQIGQIYRAQFSRQSNRRGWYYNFAPIDGSSFNGMGWSGFEDELIPYTPAPPAPELSDEDDLVIAKKAMKKEAQNYEIGAGAWFEDGSYVSIVGYDEENDSYTLDNGEEDVGEDQLTEEQPEFEEDQGELQLRSRPHEEIRIESVFLWDGEWKYNIVSDAAGRETFIDEDDIEEFEEEETVSVYIAYYMYSDEPFAIGLDDRMGYEDWYQDAREPLYVYQYDDVPRGYAEELESAGPHEAKSMLNNGYITLEMEWDDILGEAEYEDGELVVNDSDGLVYVVHGHSVDFNDGGEGEWQYGLEVVQDISSYPPLISGIFAQIEATAFESELSGFDAAEQVQIIQQQMIPPAPELSGEDDIIIAQKDEFDAVEWLSAVENDLEEAATEVEMMNEFYSQAAEQSQQLATTREVYEANYGEVPGEPAVVDVPMAAAARIGDQISYVEDFEDAKPLIVKTARVVGKSSDDFTVVDDEGKTLSVDRGMVVTAQGEKIRRRRKRRKVQPIEEVKETDPTDILEKTFKTPKPKKQPPPAEEKVQLTPLKQQPDRSDVPDGSIPVETPPEQVGPEPLQPMPPEVQQPVAPVMQPIQLVQQTPPPPPSPAPPPVPAPEEMDAVDFTDIPDEEWRNLSNAEKIRMAAVFNRIMIIEYEKITAPETGVVKSYQVEPYSYRVKRPKRTNGTPVWYLFAHDVIDNHIKAFIVRNIRDVEIVDQSFSPRWDVEFTYNERWEKYRKKTTTPGTPPSEVELTEEGFEL